MMAMVLLLVLLVACTRLLVPEKGMFVPAKGNLLAMVALTLSMAVPAEGIQYLAWWRLREAEGKLWYVWPEGFWEEVPSDYAEAIENMFQTEPEMAAYVVGMSQMVGEVSPWPPTWHIPSNMWVLSREEPEPRLNWVAQPENLDNYALSPLPDSPLAGQTRNTCPGNFQPVPGRANRVARDGDQYVTSDGRGTTTVWRDHHMSSGPSSGSAGPAAGPAQGHPWHWERPGQGQEPEKEGYWQWCTRNPDRYMYRGRGSQARREEKRHLERTGQPVPEHLKPQAHVLNKAAKQQMFLLHQRARQMASAQSQEELDELAAKLLKLQQEETKKLESLKKAKDFGNGSKKEPDGDDGTVPARKAYVGKHRSQSVPAKGTPPQAKEYGSLAAADGDGAGACVEEEEEEEEEADDQVPDWGGDPPKEGKRRKKNKKKSKSRSRTRKEDPAAKRDPDDPQDPKDPKDSPPAAATASA